MSLERLNRFVPVLPVRLKRSAPMMAVIGLILFYSLFLDQVQVGVSDDDAHYIVAAEALAQGYGYVLINFPNPVKGQLLWPPGYAAFLAPVTWLFPAQYTILQVTSIGLTVIWLGLSFIWFRRGFGSSVAAMVVLLSAVNPRIVGVATQVRSEALFLVLIFGAFFALSRWLNNPRIWSGWLFLTAFCAVYATAVRSIGLALILGLIATVFLRKWYATVILTTLIILFYLPLAIFMIQQGGTAFAPTQLNQSQIFWTADPRLLVSHIVGNFQVYVLNYLPAVLTSVIGPQVASLSTQYTAVALLVFFVKLTLLVLISGGIIIITLHKVVINIRWERPFIRAPQSGASTANFERDDSAYYYLTLIFPLLYFGVILTFQDANPRGHDAQVRYLIPILPFIFLFMIVGWLTIQDYLWRLSKLKSLVKYQVIFTVMFVGLFFVTAMGRNAINIIQPNPGNIPDISIGAAWINEHAPSDVVVACDDPVPRYLYLRRKTIRYSATDDAVTRFERVKEQGADYLLIAPRLRVDNAGDLDSDQEAFLAYLQGDTNSYKLVFADRPQQVYIFERHRD